MGEKVIINHVVSLRESCKIHASYRSKFFAGIFHCFRHDEWKYFPQKINLQFIACHSASVSRSLKKGQGDGQKKRTFDA